MRGPPAGARFIDYGGSDSTKDAARLREKGGPNDEVLRD